MSDNYMMENAKVHYKEIERLVKALDLDWDKLIEIQDTTNLKESNECMELNNIESLIHAQEIIQEYPLSVEVRSGWHAPGKTIAPNEFQILLSTGGPALRIIGELNEYNEPINSRLQAQDWGTPWVDVIDNVDEVMLNRFSQQFCF